MNYADFLSKDSPDFTIYHGLIQPLKSADACVLLSYLIHLTEKCTAKDGWIKLAATDFFKGTGLTYPKQLTARKKLKAHRLIEEKHLYLKHEMYFRVNNEALRGFAIAAGIKGVVIQ